jgi:hypothetical protein
MGTISKSTQDFFEELKISEDSSISNLLRFKDMKFGKSRKTLLHLAMKYVFNSEQIETLVKKLKSLSLKPSEKNRKLPIHVACKYGNVSGLKCLLNSCIKSLKSKDFEGNSPLALSCLHKQHEIIEILKNYPVNFLSKNHQGKNSIQIAMDSCNTEVFQQLISGACAQKATFFKCLQFALENDLKEACLLLINQLQTSDLASFEFLNAVLTNCKEKTDLIESILEKIRNTKTVKLVILLKLHVSSELIVKYCKDEIFGNIIFVANIWNRADLIQECLKFKLIHYEEVERAGKMRLKPGCQRIIEKYLTWHKVRAFLFVRKFSSSIYSKIPGLVLREVFEYL